MRIGRPNLLAIEPPARVGFGSPRLHTCQVRTRIGLTHTNAEKRLALANARQVKPLLRLSPVLQNQRPALPIRNPVRSHRRAKIQKLLHQHKSRKSAAPAAAIFPGQGDAQPALVCQRTAEVSVVAGPGLGADVGWDPLHRLREERAHWGAQSLVLGGDGGDGQGIKCGHELGAIWLLYGLSKETPATSLRVPTRRGAKIDGGGMSDI